MSRSIRYSVLGGLLALMLALLTFVYSPSQAQDEEEFIYAADIDPQFAVDWMNLLYDRVLAEKLGPTTGSRAYAYAGVTLYEAVLMGIPGNNTLAGQTTMPYLPYPDEVLEDVENPFNLDWASVANAALAKVLPAVFPAPTKETLDAIKDLSEEQMEARIEELEDEELVENSMIYGEALADALLDWIAEDGFKETREMNEDYELPSGEDWMYVLTTDGTRPNEPFWGQMRPFVMSYADECAVQPNMEYSTEEESVFYAQATEVMEVGNNLTEEQKATARFWVDTPAVTGTPGGHWVLIENQLVDQLDLTLDRAAEMYALVGMALADSFISCWSLKYQVMLLRPETYIKDNIQRRWAPYIQTPPFPEYPSGHSVVSAAAAEVLTDLFGTVAFTDASHITRGEAPRFFTSFEAAANEAAISRLYGGIHYRAAIENGMRQGRCVGSRILSYIQLRPIPQGGE